MTKENNEVVLVQPSEMYWQPGVSRGHSTSDGYELALLAKALNDNGITTDYLIQRPKGSNKDFYSDVRRITPGAPSLDNLAAKITKQNPKVVGIEAMSCYANQAIQLAKKIKAKDPDKIIVVGGYHPSGYPEILLDAKGAIDHAVLGAGEKTFVSLVKRILERDTDLFLDRQSVELPNLSDRTRIGAINKSAYASLEKEAVQLHSRLDGDRIDLHEIAIPERKLEYQRGSVSGVLSRITPDNQVMATLQTRRGCDASCIYCASLNVYGINGRKLVRGSNTRPVEDVVSELRYLSNLGINFIFFTDPTFNSHGKYMDDLTKSIIQEKRKGTLSEEMVFYAMFRPFGKDEMKRRGLSLEQYHLLKKADFTRIALGVESPDNQILKSFRRDNSIADLEAHLSAIHDVGIFTRGFMMYGHENETKESLSIYLNVMKNLSIDEWRLAPITPFVGTISGDSFLARQKEINFSKHDANTPIVIPEAIKQEFPNNDEARSFLIKWKSNTLRKIYSSSEWNKRMQESFDRFPELRNGINFYMAYLKDNLG